MADPSTLHFIPSTVKQCTLIFHDKLPLLPRSVLQYETSPSTVSQDLSNAHPSSGAVSSSVTSLSCSASPSNIHQSSSVYPSSALPSCRSDPSCVTSRSTIALPSSTVQISSNN